MVNESDNVAGGYLGEGDAVSGELRIDGETQASGNILGGYTEKGGALANSVMIDGSSVRPAENEAGEELAPPLIVGGGSADGDASDNRVAVTGGDMNLPDDLPGHLEDMPDISGTVNTQAAMIVGGMAMIGDASDNEVTVSGSSAALTGMMAGGMATGGAAAAESRASGNRLGVYDRSLAMSAMMAGGMAMTGDAANNEMTVSGGGAAVRLTKNGGSYYEASVRAGTLGNSMTDAVRDGDGNSYGFDSDSTYWGGHIGAGRLIPGSRGQWDVYGKYFHSEIEGDAFLMGGDAYRFDDMTSDRLRLGARYTADTGRAWSFYGGAAYEYEFSGDSRMKAGPWEAREESLQGSSVFGEIGVLMRDKDSPWSMDINLRGYTGEREGISGMLQLAYSF